MLSKEERKLLYWAGRDFFKGRGVILDVGAFLGASARCLAEGLRDNQSAPRDMKRIYSYDFFEWGDYMLKHVARDQIPSDGNTLTFVKDKWRGVDQYITPIKGDICAQSWDGTPVEVLFVDFTQRWQHGDFVNQTFLKSLVVGGLLIHQDYGHVVSYWLHVFMEKYKDYFDLVSNRLHGSSVVWTLKRPLPTEATSAPLNKLVSIGEIESHINASIERFEPPYSVLIEISKARFYADSHQFDKAEQAYFTISEKWNADSRIRPHIVVLRDSLTKARNSRKYQSGFFIVQPVPNASLQGGEPQQPIPQHAV